MESQDAWLHPAAVPPSPIAASQVSPSFEYAVAERKDQTRDEAKGWDLRVFLYGKEWSACYPLEPTEIDSTRSNGYLNCCNAQT